MNNIVLIGFMGVGKGRTARALASMSQIYAVDCDDLIESYANMKIKKIFKVHGESYFRDLEKQTAIWLEKNVSASIISTGGGFVNIPNLKKIGKVVYLHSDFSSIINAIKEHPNGQKKIKKRPLLQDLKKAQDLYNARLPLYRKKSDIEIEVTGKESYQVAKEIYNYWQKVSLK
jgi:shikimate kinase